MPQIRWILLCVYSATQYSFLFNFMIFFHQQTSEYMKSIENLYEERVSVTLNVGIIYIQRDYNDIYGQPITMIYMQIYIIHTKYFICLRLVIFIFFLSFFLFTRTYCSRLQLFHFFYFLFGLCATNFIYFIIKSICICMCHAICGFQFEQKKKQQHGDCCCWFWFFFCFVFSSHLVDLHVK